MEVEVCDLDKLGLCYLLIFWKDLQRALGNIFSTSRQPWVGSVTSWFYVLGKSFLLSGPQFLYRRNEGIGPCQDPCLFPTISSFLALAKAKSWGNCVGYQHQLHTE